MVSVENDAPWRARLFDERLAADVLALEAIRAQQDTVTIDHRARLRDEFCGLRGVQDSVVVDEPSRWVYYPWRRTLVGIVGPQIFSLIRLDRNRNKITRDEQSRLRRLRVGIVGLSVGHTIARTLALEGLCGELRLADFDGIDLSNLNRIPAGLLDVGVNKAVVAARLLAELDPYLPVSVFPAGLTPENTDTFFGGLDLVVEECDSLDVKLSVRKAARARRIPVVMETTDRGLLDIERFDLEPERPFFHGLLGGVDTESLTGLTVQEKIPYSLQLLSAAELSAEMAASLVDVGTALSTWPQLGGEVFAGASAVAVAVRRIGLGEALPSGRIRVDSGEQLNRLADPLLGECDSRASERIGSPSVRTAPATGVEAVLEAIRWAPSGGNAQPWFVRIQEQAVHLHADRSRTSLMDVEGRGTYVAIGAALYNAKVAAAAYGILGDIEVRPEPDTEALVATVVLGSETDRRSGIDPDRAGHYTAMMERGTNRGTGTRAPMTDELASALADAARGEGGRLHLYTGSADLAVLGDLVAAADRIRYLTPTLHEQMFDELRWPGDERANTGIDIRTLGLDAGELEFLDVVSRGDVMTRLARTGMGKALGNMARERIVSSSALAVVTVDGSRASDFVRGGSAAEAVWVSAHANGLGVQPMSPVFLYARNARDCGLLSEAFAEELGALRVRMRSLLALADDESIALVLRMSHRPPEMVGSARLPAGRIRR